MFNFLRDNNFPTGAFVVGIVADIVEYLNPLIGYFVAAPLDAYLFKWAQEYLGKGINIESRKKLKNSLIIRMVLEYIPFINFLPLSTLFVLLAWRDRMRQDKKSLALSV